jgi:hypothetical protein
VSGSALRKFRSEVRSLKVVWSEDVEGGILPREALVLLIAVVALNVIDAAMTYYAVCVYGIAGELNPLYNPANPFRARAQRRRGNRRRVLRQVQKHHAQSR